MITDENAAEVLPRFFGTSKREAKNVVAELAPEPAPARTVVTAVAAPSLALFAPAAPAGRLADQVRANSESPTQEVRDSQWNAATLPTVVEPKTAELSRVHFTVPRRLLEKLAAARDALSWGSCPLTGPAASGEEREQHPASIARDGERSGPRRSGGGGIMHPQ